MTHDPRPDVAVVDDDVAVLDSFKFMLEMAGFVVATYPSAIAYLQHQGMDPRCLILDQHMPEMTGLELTTRLRADGVTIPVLLVTSASSPAGWVSYVFWISRPTRKNSSASSTDASARQTAPRRRGAATQAPALGVLWHTPALMVTKVREAVLF